MNDPALAGKSITGDSRPSDDPFADGLNTIGLVEAQIAACGQFVNEFYTQIEANDGKKKSQNTRNAWTMMKGAIFAIGTRWQKNPEWKEHCASSLREIFHFWGGLQQLQNDFSSIYGNANKNDHGQVCLEVNEKNKLNHLWLLYKYFSGIDHHQASTIQKTLWRLRNDPSLKLEDCFKDEVFFEAVKDFFLTLSYVIDISKRIEVKNAPA